MSHNQVEAGVEAETAPGGITKPSVSAAVSIKQVFKCTTPPAVLKESIPLSLRDLNRDVKIPYSKKLSSMVKQILKETGWDHAAEQVRTKPPLYHSL